VLSWFAAARQGATVRRRPEVGVVGQSRNIEVRLFITCTFTREPVSRDVDAFVPDELVASEEMHDDAHFIGHRPHVT
jgi:hypothetical protein